jgi:hypothetical protein
MLGPRVATGVVNPEIGGLYSRRDFNSGIGGLFYSRVGAVSLEDPELYTIRRLIT